MGRRISRRGDLASRTNEGFQPDCQMLRCVERERGHASSLVIMTYLNLSCVPSPSVTRANVTFLHSFVIPMKMKTSSKQPNRHI